MLKKLSSDSIFTLVVFVLLCLSYFPLWNGDFIGDDIGRIQQLPKGQAFDILMSELGDRPLLSVSVWFDRFFLGMSPGMMRLEGLVLISGLALLMRKIVRQMSNLDNQNSDTTWQDLVIILIALHPLNSQTIGHVIQRGIILSTIGSLLATYWLVKSRFNFKSIYIKYALLAWILALLCKPNIAFFPFFWVFLLWDMKLVDRWKGLIPFFMAIFLPLVSYFFSGFNKQTVIASPLDYFLTQGEVLLIYFRLIVLPIGLKFNYDILARYGTPLFPGLLYWLIIIIGAAFVLKKIKSRTSFLFFLGMLLAFLPESSFFPIIHGAFEHRTFTPLCLLAISIAGIEVSKTSRILTGFLISLSFIFVGLNIKRSYETKDATKWALDELSHTCKIEFLALYNLEMVLDDNKIEEAEHVLRNVRKCDPVPTMDPILWTLIDIKKSDSIKSNVLDETLNVLHSDLKINPMYRRVATNVLINNIGKKLACSRSNQTCNEMHCMKENFFSNQLRALLADPVYYQREISFYVSTAKACLDELSSLTDPDSTFHKHKIRTIAAVYFNAKEGGLDSELDKAEKSERYDYLRTLLKNYRAKKISPNAPSLKREDPHR